MIGPVLIVAVILGLTAIGLALCGFENPDKVHPGCDCPRCSA